MFDDVVESLGLKRTTKKNLSSLASGISDAMNKASEAITACCQDLRRGDEFISESDLIRYDFDTDTLNVNGNVFDKDKIKTEKISEGVVKVNMIEIYDECILTKNRI